MNKSVQSIMNQIEQLPEVDRDVLPEYLKKKYPDQFLPVGAFVVGENYNFWLNEDDDKYANL